jgi:hypothetical protein
MQFYLSNKDSISDAEISVLMFIRVSRGRIWYIEKEIPLGNE